MTSLNVFCTHGWDGYTECVHSLNGLHRTPLSFQFRKTHAVGVVHLRGPALDHTRVHGRLVLRGSFLERCCRQRRVVLVAHGGICSKHLRPRLQADPLVVAQVEQVILGPFQTTTSVHLKPVLSWLPSTPATRAGIALAATLARCRVQRHVPRTHRPSTCTA